MKAVASGNPLLGTWKLKSYVVTAATGETSTPYGAHPAGYLTYSADGRMQVIGTSDGRAALREPAPKDEAQAKLYNTMFAYAGRYSVAPRQGHAPYRCFLGRSLDRRRSGAILCDQRQHPDRHIPSRRSSKWYAGRIRCRVGEGDGTVSR